jgi:hypothetical protein
LAQPRGVKQCKTKEQRQTPRFERNYEGKLTHWSFRIPNELKMLIHMITGMSRMQSHHQRHIPHRCSSYAHSRINLLVDENLRVLIIEVNVSPSMNGTHPKLDYGINSYLMHHLLAIAKIIDCDFNSSDPCPGRDLVERVCKLSVNCRERLISNRTGFIRRMILPLQIILYRPS